MFPHRLFLFSAIVSEPAARQPPCARLAVSSVIAAGTYVSTQHISCLVVDSLRSCKVLESGQITTQGRVTPAIEKSETNRKTLYVLFELRVYL